MQRRFILSAALAAALLLGGRPAPAFAKVSVMATYADLAWVAREVGGDLVTVESLHRGDQDPHQIEPRPSQVVKMSRTDVLLRVGMDLDLWADPLITASRNGRIARGGPGYVDCSTGIRKLQVPTGRVDASRGDIHVFGNPHYTLDPANVIIIAGTIRAGLARADAANAAAYRRNEEALAAQLRQKLTEWTRRMAPHRSHDVVIYHAQWVYFFSRFGLSEFGTVEPKPGIEPTAGHVAGLAKRMKSSNVGVILMASYKSSRFADLLARQSGAKVVRVPAAVTGERGVDDYFTLIDTIVSRLTAVM